MADCSESVIRNARNIAIAHIIIGILLFGFGIADRVVEYFWTGNGYFGVLAGVWMCTAGGLGIPGTRKERSTSRDAYACVFMGLSLTSALFGGIIIYFYSSSIVKYSDDKYKYNYKYYDGSYRTVTKRDNYDAEMAFSEIILLLGVAEFIVGILAAVFLCRMRPCTCTCCYDTSTQEGQVVYNANNGHVMSQGLSCPLDFPMQTDSGMLAGQIFTAGTHWNQPGIVMVTLSGAPVAVPGHVGGGKVALQSVPPYAQRAESDVVMMYAANAGCVFTQGSSGSPVATSVQAVEGLNAALTINSETLGSQPQWVMVPASLPVGDQPQVVEIAPAEAMTSDYQHLQVDLPPPYELDQEMTQKKETNRCGVYD